MAERAAADPRVGYVVRQSPKSGANICRNIGIALAKAELLVFLDDDDVLAPGCLAGRVELMRRNPDLDFAVFHAEVFERRPGDLGRPYHRLDPADDLLRFLSLDCPWQTSGPIWRRSYIAELGGFDEDLQSLQDLELHVRALCQRPRYIVIPTTDHYVRAQRDAARTSTRHFYDPDVIRSSEAVPGKLLAQVERTGLLSWSRRRALLGLEFDAAERWVRIGRLGEALRSWREACRRSRAPVAVATAGAMLLRLIPLARGRSRLDVADAQQMEGLGALPPGARADAGRRFLPMSLKATLVDLRESASRSDVGRQARLLRRRLTRDNDRLLRDYRAASPSWKLQIGGGWRVLDGWLNADIELAPGVFYMDATRPFPLGDNTFRYVFSEHMIEHVDCAAAASMLRECHRVLRPGGVIRVVTPDLASLVGLLAGPRTSIGQAYYDYFLQEHLPAGHPATEAAIANAFMRSWGHRFIYDEPTLRLSLEAAGFGEVVRRRLGESDHAALAGIEHEERYPPGLLDFESLALEATK